MQHQSPFSPFPRLLSWLLCFLVGVLGRGELSPIDAGELPGPCEPGLVDYQPFRSLLLPIAYRPVGSGPGGGRLEWLRHSSFLSVIR
ncbi:MAG: hypothetical protein D6736_12190 [Nitrospinota bacterium]|nr:MAG: hypothetical protein D6736_12190 [Nitrospinota bacterium]